MKKSNKIKIFWPKNGVPIFMASTVETEPMILEFSDPLSLVIDAMVPQVASAEQELVLGLQQHMLLLIHCHYWFLGPEYE